MPPNEGHTAEAPIDSNGSWTASGSSNASRWTAATPGVSSSWPTWFAGRRIESPPYASWNDCPICAAGTCAWIARVARASKPLT